MTISDEPRVWPKPVPRQERERIVLSSDSAGVDNRSSLFDQPEVEPAPQPESGVVAYPERLNPDQVRPDQLRSDYRMDPWSVKAARPSWSFAQLMSVLGVSCIILATFMTLGFLSGASTDPDRLARAEFIFTLDESIPDGYLREDRRLLTQIATLNSEAVIAPVAATYGFEVKELRKRVSVETVDLSEVIRLDVRHPDPAVALGVNQAVLAEYLKAAEVASPIADVSKLEGRREQLEVELGELDEQVKALGARQLADIELQTTEEELGRRISASSDRIASLEALLDEQLVRPTSASAQQALRVELDNATEELDTYTEELLTVRTNRAALAEAVTAEPNLARDVERVSNELAEVESEITRRELTAFDAAPVQILSEAGVLSEPANSPKLQGMVIGALLGLPFVALAAWLQRRRQLNRG